MVLLPRYRYELEVDPVRIIGDLLNCQQYISNSFDISGFVKCQVTSKAIKIFFNPSEELNEELIFQQLNSILQQIGIAFISITIRQFIPDLGRTLASSVTGGVLGARAGGFIGSLIGGLAAAYVDQKLLCWKKICKYECDDFGNFHIAHYSDGIRENNQN